MKTFKNLVLLSFILVINLTFFGCMSFVPYAMQPSYYEFKEMCELNKLPNNEEKYNKILSYFDLSLDTLDWEKHCFWNNIITPIALCLDSCLSYFFKGF